MRNKNSSDADTVKIWNAGVAAVDAKRITADAVELKSGQLRIAGRCFELDQVSEITVVGFGKCSGLMAAGLESALRSIGVEVAVSGLVIVPQGQSVETEKIELVVGRDRASNFPTDAVVDETRRMLKMIEASGDQGLVIALVSGGGSALLEDPLVPLEDLVSLSRSISAQGASIKSLNTVRRALSGVKAGGLANHLLQKTSANLVALVISDVIGDDLSMVASGPTVLNGESSKDRLKAAQEVLESMPDVAVPDSVKVWLSQSQKGVPQDRVEAGSVPPLPPAGGDQRISNHLLANNATAVDAAKRHAVAIGYQVVETNLDANRNVVDVADDWVELALKFASSISNGGSSGPIAIVAGGEPTVTLCQSPGCGGRNLQLAALVMKGLLDRDWPIGVNIAFASGGSDGEDGTAAVSGGCFDAATLRLVAGGASLKQSSPDRSLLQWLHRSVAENDCFGFFDALGQHVPVPPVSTNVCDVQVLLIGGEDETVTPK